MPPAIRLTLLAALLGACASPGPDLQPPQVPTKTSPRDDSPHAQHLALVQAELAGEDWTGAREALIPLVIEAALTNARTALNANRPRDAFQPLEAALALAPESADLHFMRAQAAWATAPTDSQPIFFYSDAADSYEAAFRAGMAEGKGQVSAREVACLVGMSQAKRMSLDSGAALTLARNAAKALEQISGPAPELKIPLSRVWAEAAFDEFVAARKEESPSEALFFETEDQLSFTCANADHRQWALVQLSNLYQWRGGPEAAMEPMERALEFAPDDPDLHARLVNLLETTGGRVAVLQRYERWCENHPNSTHGWWYRAVTLFHQGLEGFETGQGDENTFMEAEGFFGRYGKLVPELLGTAQAYQASCRSARGFILLNAGDLNGAERTFLSMEELFSGAIEVAMGERIPSGLVGLDFVVGKHATMPEDLGAMQDAARVANYLHGYRPDSAAYANNAGFFNRDAAVLLEIQAQDAASRGAEQESKALFAQALLVMNNSWEAYQVAAKLAPKDVRMVNDAGLVMTYYLRQDVELARALLEQARLEGDVTLGDLTHEQRTERDWADPIEAWGDAYQNLGILHLTLLADPAGAKPYFERALEIGPPRRSWLKTDMLPMVERLIAGEVLPPEQYSQMVWLHQHPTR